MPEINSAADIKAAVVKIAEIRRDAAQALAAAFDTDEARAALAAISDAEKVLKSAAVTAFVATLAPLVENIDDDSPAYGAATHVLTQLKQGNATGALNTLKAAPQQISMAIEQIARRLDGGSTGP